MVSTSKITFYVGGAILGIFSLLMLVSAVLLAYTPEITSGWAKAGYIILPAALFTSVVMLYLLEEKLDSWLVNFMQENVIVFLIMVLAYFTAVAPQWLAPLYASLKIWSGASIYALLGGNAVWVIPLALLTAFLIMKLGMDLWLYQRWALPLTQFTGAMLYFLVLLPLLLTKGEKLFIPPDYFPMALVFIPAMMLNSLAKWIEKELTDRSSALRCAIFYGVLMILTPVYLWVNGLIAGLGIYTWMQGVLVWYWYLVLAQPWTIIFAPVALFFINILINGLKGKYNEEAYLKSLSTSGSNAEYYAKNLENAKRAEKDYQDSLRTQQRYKDTW